LGALGVKIVIRRSNPVEIGILLAQLVSISAAIACCVTPAKFSRSVQSERVLQWFAGEFVNPVFFVTSFDDC